MLGCGCFLLIVGFIVTVVAGYVFPPLALIGIFMMAAGWKGIIAGTNGDDKKD